MIPFNVKINGEPFLTKYKILYNTKDHAIADKLTLATKWLIHFSDGHTSLEEISSFIELIIQSPSMTGQMIALDGGQHLGWAQAKNDQFKED